jgi:hypothetical protein
MHTATKQSDHKEIVTMKTKNQKAAAQPIPQVKVHSGLSAGASLESCLSNLDYWKKAYEQKCLFR